MRVDRSTWWATIRSCQYSRPSSTPRSRTGLKHNLDYNSDHLDGISQEQITVRGGTRLSTYIAYVKPVVDAAEPARFAPALGCTASSWKGGPSSAPSSR